MTFRKTFLVLAVGSLSLPLAGCKVDNRSLLSRILHKPTVERGVYTPAADIDYLPPAQAYPVAARAYALDRRFYGAPPDYAFTYADEQPWVWEAVDDSLMFAEPYGDAYRFYYYEPGAAYPYFVRDADYGYALGSTGLLLAVFDAVGALLAVDDYPPHQTVAVEYWTRGYDLHRTYWSAPRLPVDTRLWAERAPVVERIQAPWIAAFPRQDNGRHLGWTRGAEDRDRVAVPGVKSETRPKVRAEPRREIAQVDQRRKVVARAAPAHAREAAWRSGPSFGPRSERGAAEGPQRGEARMAAGPRADFASGPRREPDRGGGPQQDKRGGERQGEKGGGKGGGHGNR